MTRPSSNGVQLALRSQMLKCDALPLSPDRVYGNTSYQPTQGHEYIEEDYVPATSTLKGMVQNGLVEDTGLYIIRWYGVANTGEKDLNDKIDSLLALFPAGSYIPLADNSGLVVRVRGDHAPYRGQARQAKPGFVLVVATIPYRVLSINSTT